MTGEWNILIFTTIFLIFQLTNSQPSTSNLTRATLQEHCLTGNGSLIRLKNLNDSGSPIELLTRPMWSSVDGNDTPWIADIGCYDITIAPHNHRQPPTQIANNTIEGCYLECHKDYINCGKNESIYFALKVTYVNIKSSWIDFIQKFLLNKTDIIININIPYIFCM